MEIRDPVHGTIDISSDETQVLDSVAYQRLRSIKQLGFSEFSFPGATHNRYLHSIGVCHLSGQAFDSIFKNFQFSTPQRRSELRQATRLAALLHDIGHGPLSHTTEEVMPPLKDLQVSAYGDRREDLVPLEQDRQANHEDYTIKFITESSLSEVLRRAFPDIDPIYIACLVDPSLRCPDDFFMDQGLNFRTVLGQIISSELDVDRMDYLERDAYFCGTNYGRVEVNWLLANLTFHNSEGQLNLALNRRALYTFDDFLLSRHHMHLMVYFHHKSGIYEEILLKYLGSKDCQFFLPPNIEEYIQCTDYAIYEHLRKVDNEWARRITERRPFQMLFEHHSTQATDRIEKMEQTLESEGFRVIMSSSMARLSKYHSASTTERAFSIYVTDEYDHLAKPYPIEMSTEIFQKYEEIRRIERIYVDPDQLEKARHFIRDKKL